MAFELFTKNKNHHILHSLLNRKWTYISYIPEVYYKKKDLHYMLSRQNKREALVTILFSATPILSAVFQPIK